MHLLLYFLFYFAVVVVVFVVFFSFVVHVILSFVNVTRSRVMSHLSKMSNSYFLMPLSHNFKMRHFDANPLWISGYRVMKNLSVLETI